jgi:hypothetical protein
MTLTHAVVMAGVTVVGVLVAFWILSSIAGIIWFFIKFAAVIAVVGGVFWLLARRRR